MSAPETLQVVILAGGMATRLGGLSQQCPKAMLPVGPRPFLEWVVAHLRSQGFERFHLCLGHLADQVLDWVRGQKGADFTFHVDEAPRGTGGCLLSGMGHLDPEFLLLLGDTYLPIDYRRARSWAMPGDAGGMVVTSADCGVTANVAIRGDRVVDYAKGERRPELLWTDSGVCLLRRDALDAIADREPPVDLAEVFGRSIRSGTLAAHAIADPFVDIGTPERYRALIRQLG